MNKGRPEAAEGALQAALAGNFGVKAWPLYHVLKGKIAIVRSEVRCDGFMCSLCFVQAPPCAADPLSTLHCANIAAMLLACKASAQECVCSESNK